MEGRERSEYFIAGRVTEKKNTQGVMIYLARLQEVEVLL